MFFLLLLTIKVKLVDAKMQSAHLCVIYTSSTKNCALSGFKHDFCFFVKSKMATIDISTKDRNSTKTGLTSHLLQ